MASGWIDPNPNGFITTPVDLGAIFRDNGRPPPVDNGLLTPVPADDPSRLPGRRTWMPAYAITIEALTTILLLIRLISRLSKLGGRPGLDDIFISIAWIMGVGVTVCCIYGSINLGWGLHMLHTDPFLFHKSAFLSTILQILFVWSTMFTKLSILLFYRRLVIGTYSRKFKWALWFGMFLAVASTVVPTILLLISCTPVKAIWMQYDITYVIQNAYKFHCDPIAKTILIGQITGSLSVITDFYSVLLPALLLMRIRINRRQKLGLMLIFSVGFLVVAAGAARTYFLSEAEKPKADRGWLLYSVVAASLAECNVGIICACAPSLKSVCGQFFRDITSRGPSKEVSKNTSNDSEDPLKRHTFISYDTNYSDFDTVKSSIIDGSSKPKILTSRQHKASQKFDQGLSATHEYGQDAFSPVTEGYVEEPITRFESHSSGEAPQPEVRPRPAMVRHEMSDSPFDIGGLLSSPPAQPRTQNTAPTAPSPAVIRSDNQQSSEGLRVPAGDEQPRAPSLIFIDNENGEEKIKRVRYDKYIESSDSSTEDLTLSFPHMNPVISRAQSLKDAAELARHQAFKAQSSLHKQSQSVSHQPSAGINISTSGPQRPYTAGAAPSGQSAFGARHGSIRNALRGMNVAQQPQVAAAASTFESGWTSQRPQSRHRNSISHISDPSESGSWNGDAESESDCRVTRPPTITDYQVAQVQMLQPVANPHNPSALNISKIRPSTASSSALAGNFVLPKSPVHQHSHSLSSLRSSSPFAFQSIVAGLNSDPPNVALNNPFTSSAPKEEPANVGVAVPWTPNRTAPSEMPAPSATNGDSAGIGRPRVRKVLSREKWRTPDSNR